MNKKQLNIIARLAFIIAFGMFLVGSNSSHMSELKDFFWVPIPIALIALVAAMKKDDED
ncbi:hypothetical protein OAK19_01990 [Aureispira]|jgi:hypothetical protein|nr:hypothetical protein [Aureispira sp.]